ncbi:hypothetical protein [Nocardia sp. NPDC050412]|uniref:hypothetical protein n=1 Tax=Nocardia sp. NPDC050412 TaxID=3364320 RepID=UPI00378D457D
MDRRSARRGPCVAGATVWSTNPLMHLSDRFEAVVRMLATVATLAALDREGGGDGGL